MLRQRTLRAARAPAVAENARRDERSPGHGPGEVAALPARRAFSRAVERFAKQHVSGGNRRSDKVVLVGFCGLNPLKDYALDELARCAKDPNLRRGLKLHFGNSGVDYADPQHVERLRRVFRAANGYKMAIVVHMRASFGQKLPYGRDAALVMLNELAPAAPDVPIQIAHLAGGGGPAHQAAHDALDVLADAVSRRDPRTKQLWFDVTGMGTVSKMTPDELTYFAAKIRQIGVQRIVYGSDAPSGGNPPPQQAWAAFRKLPLSDEEFRTIAGNLAPYMR